MLGSTIGDPTVCPGAQKPALSGYHQPRGIRMECLGDESFADTGTVRVGSVDKGDALLHRPPQQRDGFALIPRRTPDPRARDAHCAKANLPHRKWAIAGSPDIFDLLLDVIGAAVV